MHIEHESPLPALSASTGMSLEGVSESSCEGICSGSFRKEAKSKYVSIAVNLGGGS